MHARIDERVLILRPDNLGDMVLFSGALRHLRKLYPHAEVALCAQDAVHNYLELCPCVDRIVSWKLLRLAVRNETPMPFLDRIPAFKGLWRVREPLRRLMSARARRCCAAETILLPLRAPDYDACRAVQRLQARRKVAIVGDTSNQTGLVANNWADTLTDRLPMDDRLSLCHELEITRSFLGLLGLHLTASDLWPEVWVSDQDRRWAREHIPLRCGEGEVVVAIAPGVTTPTGKQLPGSWYATVFKGLVPRHYQVVVLGSKSDTPICAETAMQLRCCANVVQVRNLAGQTTIREMIEGLRRCDIALGADAAALHIAVTLGKPTVALVGGGHPGRFYPWGDPEINRVVTHRLPCYGCNWRCLYSTFRCIQEIEPRGAAEELNLLIQRLTHTV